MSNKSGSGSQATSTGIGFTGVLQVAFIVLKLLGKINWSWWWVLSPMWISIALVVLIIIAEILFMRWFMGE